MGSGVITGVVPGQSGVTLLARVLGQNGAPITQATITSIAWTLTDLTAGAALASGTFTVASAVFDSLQLDPRWAADGVGYNFLGTLAASNFALASPSAGVPGQAPAPRRYQCDVAFTPASGEAFRVVFQFSALSVFG